MQVTRHIIFIQPHCGTATCDDLTVAANRLVSGIGNHRPKVNRVSGTETELAGTLGLSISGR
jgi:hypothetical protein